MYRQHFGLRDKPFRVVPSPRFLFASETHDESRARILYGIRESRGFVVVTGGIGLGKTTVLLSVLDQLDTSVRSALVFNPVESYAQLLRLICFEFGVESETDDEVLLMQRLNLFLVDRHAAGESCVLLIDEAQNLSVEVLEKVRTLSNLQTENESLLQIVLVGQPELLDRLADPRLEQLRQRVGVWHEIVPLSAEETRSYIWHRLRLAGAAMPERLIDDRSCLRVLTRTHGIPRLVNQLCDTALVIAYGQNSETVTTDHIDEAALELRLEPESEAAPRLGSSGASVQDARSHTTAWWWATAAVIVVAALGVWRGGYWERWWGSQGDAPVLSGVPGPAASSTTEADSGTTDLAASPAGEADSGAAREEPTRSAQVLRAAAARRAEVERWRGSGRRVYAVHLASFRTRDNAEQFAREFVQRFPDWSEPFYVDRSGDDTPWYRVLAGGFLDRTEARDRTQLWKSERGVGYAQPTQLEAEAEPLTLEPVGAR